MIEKAIINGYFYVAPTFRNKPNNL